MERDFGEAGAQLRKRKSPSLTKDWFEEQVPHRSSPGIFSEQQLHNVRLSVGSEEVTPGFWPSSKVVRKKPYFAVRSSASCGFFPLWHCLDASLLQMFRQAFYGRCWSCQRRRHVASIVQTGDSDVLGYFIGCTQGPPTSLGYKQIVLVQRKLSYTLFY